MKVLKTTLVAMLISGFAANAQNIQAISPKETAATIATPVKAELQSAYKAYQTVAVNGEKVAYDKFLSLVYPVLSSHKAVLVDDASEANVKAYEEVVQAFNSIITVSRDNNKVKTLASMQKFIDLVKN